MRYQIAMGFAEQCTSAGGEHDAICQWIFNQTGWEWVRDGGYFVLSLPIQIVLILLIAIIARWLLNHAINRVVDRAAEGKVPPVLRPLRDRPSASATENHVPERRRQRAAAIGSVLKSFVSAVIFTIAVLMILDLFGFNLAPILTSLGIVGVALGFGAQTLVKDLISGLFMLLEDQYGVGDLIDTGEATGIVESVGLRTVTIRDLSGTLWYVRNGEILRIGNKSQGYAQVVIDLPLGFTRVDEATEVISEAVTRFAEDPEHSGEFLEPPKVLGVEQITADGAVVRVLCKTVWNKQWTVQRELHRRLIAALDEAGIAAEIQASRSMRAAAPSEGNDPP